MGKGKNRPMDMNSLLKLAQAQQKANGNGNGRPDKGSKDKNHSGKIGKKDKSRDNKHKDKSQRHGKGEKAWQDVDGQDTTRLDPLNQLNQDLGTLLDEQTLAEHIVPEVEEVVNDDTCYKSLCIELAVLLQSYQLRRQWEANVRERRNSRRKSSPHWVHSRPFQASPQAARLPNYEPTESSLRHNLPSQPSGTQYAYAEPARHMSFVMTSPRSTNLMPATEEFLQAVRARLVDGLGWEDLISEQNFGPGHQQMAQEVQRLFPDSVNDRPVLSENCRKALLLPTSNGTVSESSAALVAPGIALFLTSLSSKLLPGTFNRGRYADATREALNAFVVCLGDATLGNPLLPTVVQLARSLTNASLSLDRQPEPPAPSTFSAGKDQTAKNANYVEEAANSIREAFVKCLGDRSGTTGAARSTTLEGKRVGIYLIANLCLKLLFWRRNLSSATTIFGTIDAQSPPLSLFPATQRVTYLYYLGRYHFANSHFFRAQLVLQAAYDQCHLQALKHRNQILQYLIASNICLGRFPSANLLARQDAAGLADRFIPLCRLIQSGNLAGFREFLRLEHVHSHWFLAKGILLQLRDKGEVLVWRSLARKVFVVAGFPGEDNRLPFLRLHYLQIAAQIYAQKIPTRAEPVDQEFVGLEAAIAETGFDIDSGGYSNDANDAPVPHDKPEPETGPCMDEVEAMVTSLIQQDLLQGFSMHNNPRFAIPGAKAKGPLAVGFPPVWEVISRRHPNKDVPGWVQPQEKRQTASGNLFGTGGQAFTGGFPIGAVG